MTPWTDKNRCCAPQKIHPAVWNTILHGALGAGKTGFTNFKGVRMVGGAGHWPHEEQPEIVSQHLVDFLKTT